MKRKEYYILVIAVVCCICLLAGCETEKTYSGVETAISPEEISEEQFIEIASPEGTVLCQIVGKKALIDFFQNEKREEWKETSEIPMQAELQYMITSYEKVTEEFWQGKGAPEISESTESIYEYNGDFYMESVFEGYTVNYHIPVSAGEYMVGLARSGSDISDKNDIFASWGIDALEVEDEEEDVYMESENEEDHHLYRAEELAKVSKEQKLEISCQDSEIVCTMTDLEEIADFYNQIKRETWVEIEGLPEGKSNICAITIYQLERHTIEKNLIEDEKLTLFEAQNQYYILDMIPSHSEDMDDMEIFYSIPDNISNYIIKLVNQN